MPLPAPEGWDSWDIDSAPKIAWATEYQPQGGSDGKWTPGWHGGVATVAARAVLNGARHRSSPNILYADGHVIADANRPFDPAEDGLDDQKYEGPKAYTWSNYHRIFGNLDRVIPNCEWINN